MILSSKSVRSSLKETSSTSHLPFKVTVNLSKLKHKLDTTLNLGIGAGGLARVSKIMTDVIGSPIIKAKRSGLKPILCPAHTSRLRSGYTLQTCFILRLGILRILCYRLSSYTRVSIKVQQNGISKSQFRSPLATRLVCSPKSVRIAKAPVKVSQAQHLQLASFL